MRLSVYLKIWCGLQLILRNIAWKVAEEPIEIAINGRNVHKSIGFNSREVLTAACVLKNVEIIVPKRLFEDGNVEENQENLNH